ncbi:DEAH (Asp-Glu-Ala-His) box polypeptide 34 [Boothiomyces sp. JEL0866]|nr:DEAH (Asp-Glu-Ala-His) box polypeptide 34 [Boothiomyces sp. JEL0866]
MQREPWNRTTADYLFGKDGMAPFKRYSHEYDDFVVFYTKYKQAKPEIQNQFDYAKKGLELFQDFQKKKFEKLSVKINKERDELPVKKYQQVIIETVRDNRVVLIAADTGAGKSTQIPQYLMEAGFNKIACTQPRRIACYSLAKRVSYESLNQYGSEIAYQVRFDGSKTNQTRVLFLTEGVLLRQFALDPYLKDYNVIIIDEVHERHITGDFLLGILKKMMEYRPDIHLVLMSATINAELFSRYFDAPIIEIPGRMYPVDEPDSNLTDPKSIQDRLASKIRFSIPSRNIKIKAGPYLKILERIDQKIPANERGDLLIFVSGMNEIGILSEELKQYAAFTRKWIVLELHSSLSVEEQEKVFDIAPEGVRKCIISTNIAETSVTIDGIRFIIDSGKVKEIGHDSLINSSKLSEYWISKSSAKQRAGRAGRTGPGECFRFYSKAEYEGFNDFPVPEILRMPLDSTILAIKSLGLGDPLSFDFIEQPSEDNISNSILKLVDIGCLDDKFEITNLGKVLSSMPVETIFGKMLVLGSVSELVTPVLAIAAVLSIQSPYTRVQESESRVTQKRREMHSIHGDPFTLMNIFAEWLKEKSNGQKTKKWAKSRGIEEQRMYEIVKLKSQFENILKSYLQNDGEVETEEQMLERLEDMPKYQKRAQKRLLEKRKRESRATTRKFLKLDESVTEIASASDEEDEKAEETVQELEFKISHDAQDLLIQSDVTLLSTREISILKLILCSGLYPNIAISDENNFARGPNDQVFHTRNKRFLNLLPTSVFAYQPELLQGEEIAPPDPNSNDLDSLHSKRAYRELLCYTEILETTKPYLMNVTRLGALPVALLFAKTVDISNDLKHLVVDEWLEIEFKSKEDAAQLLELGSWLRYSWLAVVNNKLTNFDQKQSQSIPQVLGGIVFQPETGSVRKERLLENNNLDSIPYIPLFIKQMRNSWIELTSTEVAESLSDIDVTDKLVDLVETEVDYVVRKLRLTHINSLFGYEPYSLEVQENYMIQVTPSFRYYINPRELADSEILSFRLPKFIEVDVSSAEKRESQAEIELECKPSSNSKDKTRYSFECRYCQKSLLLTKSEITRHENRCLKK